MMVQRFVAACATAFLAWASPGGEDSPPLRRGADGFGDVRSAAFFAQSREKGYAEPYLADGRPIWLIGLSFDSRTRHLVDFAAVRYGGTETGTTETRRSEDA